eukprot:365026-Chlamydomonas_euryale.AAC.10
MSTHTHSLPTPPSEFSPPRMFACTRLPAPRVLPCNNQHRRRRCDWSPHPPPLGVTPLGSFARCCASWLLPGCCALGPPDCCAAWLSPGGCASWLLPGFCASRPPPPLPGMLCHSTPSARCVIPATLNTGMPFVGPLPVTLTLDSLWVASPFPPGYRACPSPCPRPPGTRWCASGKQRRRGQRERHSERTASALWEQMGGGRRRATRREHKVL